MNEELKNKGYFVVRNFLSKELCDFARVYYKIRRDTLDFTMDSQCPKSMSFYADAFCETILLSSCKKLSEIANIQLVPQYSYTRIYQKGDELVIHRDRPECQYSATLCMGRPENEPISSIYMSKTEHKRDGTELQLEVGDLCFYSGCDMYHWREPFEQSWYLQTFIHYVDRNGSFGNRIFDGRRSLGIPKT
jgi:hypothetical protein